MIQIAQYQKVEAERGEWSVLTLGYLCRIANK